MSGSSIERPTPCRLPISSLEFSDTSIWLYIGDVQSQLGQIVGVLGPRPEHPDLDALEEAAGVGWNAACSVLNVFVHHSLAHQGYGVDLYEALARAAQHRHGAPIVSSAYFGASISRDSRRTWNSQRLASRITVRGLCATIRPAAAEGAHP